MVVHRGSLEMNENMSLPGTPLRVDTGTHKSAQNWPRLDE